LLGRIPTDGSKTGTYTVSSNPMAYSSVSITITTEGFTRVDATQTGFTNSVDSALSFTSASASYTFSDKTTTYSTKVL